MKKKDTQSTLEGKKAPLFSLSNQDGKMISLKGYIGKGNVLLYFYPKDMTSGCTVEAIGFSELKAKLQKAGVTVFGISKDSVDRHKKFCEKENLKIDLLSDEVGNVLQKYGVWKEKTLYGRKYMGISRESFFIGKNGKVLKHWMKAQPKDHPDEVLAFAKGL